METPLVLVTSLNFKLRRCELVPPASPTPYEYKQLSDIDDQQHTRFQMPIILFYRHNPRMAGRNAATIIKEAISKTLVFYYHFAGRLREGPARKLFVECTGEGILFIEADADVSLRQFGNTLQPPFPCFKELFFGVPGSKGILNCPLLIVQVTQLVCGGFIISLRWNHTMADGSGIVQFMAAIGEMVAGASAPSVLPVWKRAILSSRLTVTHSHREYDESADKGTIISPEETTLCSFFLGPSEMSTLRRNLPTHLRHSTSFEILTAFLWRCRTIALQPDPGEEVRLSYTVNVRGKINPPLLPTGYYGNGFASPTAVATARELCENPIDYALDLVKKVKAETTVEYLKSVEDFLLLKGRPCHNLVGMFFVSDTRKSKFEDIDYGWGKPIYSGPAIAYPVTSYYVAFKNSKGENGVLVPVCLPTPAMERFKMEVDRLLKAKQPVKVEKSRSAL